MRYLLLVSVLILSVNAFSQEKKTKHIRLQNQQLQSFVSSKTNLKPIEFEKIDTRSFELMPDTVFPPFQKYIYNNTYSTVYAGHQYIFKKQFGEFPESDLLKILDSLELKKCYWNSFKGKIYPDHIDITHESSCPGKKKEGIEFIKVEEYSGMVGGPKAFQKLIGDGLAGKGLLSKRDEELPLFYKVIVNKDSSVSSVTPLDSSSIAFDSCISEILLHRKCWIPYKAGGRAVKAYKQIFILLRKDGTIEADYY